MSIRTEASRYGSLAEAVEVATEAVDPRLRHPQTTLVVTRPVELGRAVVEVPSQVALAVEPGGSITIREGQTLAIHGPIDAGFYPIFGCPERFTPDRVVLEGNRFIERVVPQWWGATGGDTDDTDAILYAIDALTSRVPGRHRIGGTVFFPLGCYHIRPDAIDVRALSVTFEGAGSRNYYDYAGSPTCLRVMAGGDATSFGIRHGGVWSPSDGLAEGGRNFTLRRLALTFEDGFTGHLLDSWGAGLTIEDSFLGGEAKTTSPCASLVRTQFGHHFNLVRSSFDRAEIGVRIETQAPKVVPVTAENPTGITHGATNANHWHIAGCVFYNFGRSAIETVSHDGVSPPRETLGISIVGCAFDPIYDTGLRAKYGLRIYGLGFSITGCAFAGSNAAACPSVAFASIIDGEGQISGCVFNNADGVSIELEGGRTQVSSNRFTANAGLVARKAASLVGSGNRFAHQGTASTGMAVALEQTGTGFVDFGPNLVTGRFAQQYALSCGARTKGRVVLNDVPSTSRAPGDPSRGVELVGPSGRSTGL